MFLVGLLRYALLLLVPLSVAFSTYLYLYPVFHQCAFPSPGDDAQSSPFLNTLREHVGQTALVKAPFRLLALGDPQLEGDTSIPDPQAPSFPNLAKFWQDALLLDDTEHGFLERIRYSLHDLIDFYLDDIPRTLDGYRKRLDLLGNDYYLAHVYRTLHWWTRPTHVSVLGDLVGSQWIEDDEFNRRGWRYWNRVFKQAQRVPDEVTSEREDWSFIPQLGEDADIWSKRIINIAGNHDIGYAGDLTPERFERFERVFGRANYELRFQLPLVSLPNSSIIEQSSNHGELEIPQLRIIVLNDMNLDTPALSKDLQDMSYNFVNRMITTSHLVTRQALFTLVLTHIPMHKEEGICVDAPFFDFHDNDDDNESEGGGEGDEEGDTNSEKLVNGVKEQNHLSLPASKGILEGIFGMSGDASVDGHGIGRNGLVVTGHDHEGCDVYHYINQSSPSSEREWQALRWADAQSDDLQVHPGIPGLREITLRSMMGEFGGSAGLLSLWFDPVAWEWKSSFDTCALGVQHYWWAVHILDLVTVIVLVIFIVVSTLDRLGFLKTPHPLKVVEEGEPAPEASEKSLSEGTPAIEDLHPRQYSTSLSPTPSSYSSSYSPSPAILRENGLGRERESLTPVLSQKKKRSPASYRSSVSVSPGPSEY